MKLNDEAAEAELLSVDFSNFSHFSFDQTW